MPIRLHPHVISLLVDTYYSLVKILLLVPQTNQYNNLLVSQVLSSFNI